MCLSDTCYSIVTSKCDGEDKSHEKKKKVHVSGQARAIKIFIADQCKVDIECNNNQYNGLRSV